MPLPSSDSMHQQQQALIVLSLFLTRLKLAGRGCSGDNHHLEAGNDRYRVAIPKAIGLILGLELPTQGLPWCINTRQSLVRDRQLEQRAQYWLRRGGPILVPCEVTPTMGEVAVANDASVPSHTLRELLQFRLIQSEIFRRANRPGLLGKYNLRFDRATHGRQHDLQAEPPPRQMNPARLIHPVQSFLKVKHPLRSPQSNFRSPFRVLETVSQTRSR